MPDWKNIVRDRIASLRLAPAAQADLIEELAQHLEDRYRELRSAGTSEEDSLRQALAELADFAPLRDALERSRRLRESHVIPAGKPRSANLAADLWSDLRFAGRTMRSNPLFVLFVVLTLGLGIGANTTVFTLINTLILNPLPLPDADRLAAIAITEAHKTGKAAVPLPISFLNLKDYQAANQVFSDLAGYTSPNVVTLHAAGGSERMFAEVVTGNYFAALGLKPAAGRFFSPGEDGAAGAHAVAVLNFGTWQGRFGGTPDIVGRVLRINNLDFTVIGVAPRHFIGMNAVFGPDLWIPSAMSELLLPTQMADVLSNRTKAIFLGVGRLRPGIRRTQAQADLTAIAAGLAHEYPETNEGRTAMVRPIRDLLFYDSTGGTDPVLFGGVAMLLVAAIVLLIACSNVANLLLARSAARGHEIAVRLAMGASRGRLIRQLLTESVLLGCLGGAVGLSIGYAGVRLLWTALPMGANFITPKLDTTVLAFTVIVSLLTGIIFGLMPALRASRVDFSETLKEEGRTMGRSRRRITMANALLVSQVAFSFLLLMTAALFLRSIGRAYQIDPGFETRHLALIMTNPGQAGYNQARTKAFYKEVRERVAALPGVESVSFASNLPLWGRLVSGLQIEGRSQHSKSDIITSVLNTVDLGYFETFGIRIDRGRAFTEVDRQDSTPVAIVNEKLAHDYWPGQDPLGKRIQLPGEKTMRQVVGVARNANYSTFAEPPQPCIYVPLEQNYSEAMILYVRTKADPARVVIPIQREVRAAGPEILLDNPRTGQSIVRDGLFQARIGVALLSVFGLLALGLASIGLYGIMAYSVNRRTREIGVRMALGAARGSVLRLILKQGMSLVLTGTLIGFAATLAVGGLLSRALYGVSPADPLSIAGASLVLLLVALVACYLPARWASRLDPLAALRQE